MDDLVLRDTFTIEPPHSSSSSGDGGDVIVTRHYALQGHDRQVLSAAVERNVKR